ncbi:MAG: sulfurtransferase TusA family protein [Anaerolineae bacterium]
MSKSPDTFDETPHPDAVIEMLGTPQMDGSTCALLTPAIRARLREMAPGQVLEVRVDDPAARDDMAAWTRLAGHELVQTTQTGEAIRFFVRKRGA